MKKRYKVGIIVFALVLFIATLIWGITQSNNDKFWNATFYDILNIFVTIILGIIGFLITILIVEEKNDNRRLVDAVVVIIDKMDKIIESNLLIPQTINVESNEYKKFLSAKKHFSNYISILEREMKVLKINNEIIFIKNKYHECEIIIETCFDNNVIKMENQSKIEACLHLINQKLCELRISLFSPQHE